MSEREPAPDVLGAVNELRGEVSEVRIGLGDVRGRLERLDGTVAEQGERLDRLTGEVAEQGRRVDGLTGEVATMKRDLPAQIVAGVLMGFERSAYVSELRTLRAEVDELKIDVAELKRASGK